MKKVLQLIFTIITIIGKVNAQNNADKVTRPNIIYIMADDHAQRAISAYGSDLIATPNIDRLAKEGMLFENSFVTNSICAPSRAAMLTGKFSHINGLRDNLDTFDGNQVTFPKLLQKAGYRTGVIGKWHLKSTPQGFDYSDVLINQGEYYQPRFVRDHDTTIVEGYVTDIITDKAIQFIKNTKKDQPFCLLYHHKAPHRNWMPKLEDLSEDGDTTYALPKTFRDKYKGRPAAASADMRISDMYLSNDMKLQKDYYPKETGTGGNRENDGEKQWEDSYNRLTDEQQVAWDAYYQTINSNFKADKLKGKKLNEWKYQRYMNDYLKCIKAVDDNVGRLLDYLDANGLTENTIVVYTSDQGFYLGEHGWYDKRFMYEESLRTPLMIRYPKHIEKGSVATQLVQNIDYAPTFLDFAGVAIPTEMQGASLRNILIGKNQKDWRTSIYYHYYEYPEGWHGVRKHNGVRTERYKLVHFYGDMDYWELYDLQKDPMEMQNRYEDKGYALVRKELHEKLSELQKQYKDNATR